LLVAVVGAGVVAGVVPGVVPVDGGKFPIAAVKRSLTSA